MSEVLDLNDLVKAIEFNVLGGEYTIASMNDAKMKKVMGLSKEIGNLSTEERKEPLTEEEESKLLELQNTILHECVDIKEGKDLKQVTKAKFAEWPMKLKNKVLELIFGQLSIEAPEGESEKN